MHRKALISIAVGSILGSALPGVYAAGQQPAAAPSPDNQQQTAPTAAEAAYGRDVAPQAKEGDIRADRKDIQADRKDIQSDRADIARDQANIRGDQRDIRADRQDIHTDHKDMRADRQDIRTDRQDMHMDHQDLRADRGDLRRDHGNFGNSERNDRRGDLQDQRFTRNTWQSAAGQHTDGVKPGMTPAAMANNTAENNKKAQAATSVHKAWYHFW